MKLSSVISLALLSFVVMLLVTCVVPSLTDYTWVMLVLSSVFTAVVLPWKRSYGLITGVILGAAVLALFRASFVMPGLAKVITEGPVEMTVSVLGSERRIDGYQIRLARTRTHDDGHTCMTLFAKTRDVRRLRHGDVMLVRGNILPLEDDSYGQYLRSQGMECTLDNLAIISHKPGPWSPLRMLEGSRMHVEKTINGIFPEPDASLIIGLLTGSRGMIPSSLQADFKTTGLTHILAISGYNITMILLLLSAIFFWLPLKVRVFPCAAVLIIFTLFTGASASVVRACIMGLLGLLALSSGREQILRLSMLWTLAGMAAWNPLQLWWDSGFHLSFLALAGLMEFSELIAPWTKRILPNVMGVEESVRTTLAAQVLTSPWILFAFERLSIISPLSNFLILPAIPFAMATGAIATFLGLISPSLGSIVALATLPFTQWVVRVTELIAKIPGASIEWQPGFLWIAVSYGLIGFWRYRYQKR